MKGIDGDRFGQFDEFLSSSPKPFLLFSFLTYQYSMLEYIGGPYVVHMYTVLHTGTGGGRG